MLFKKLRNGLTTLLSLFISFFCFAFDQTKSGGLLTALLVVMGRCGRILRFALREFDTNHLRDSINDPMLEKLRIRCQGLHSLLPKVGNFSILLVIRDSTLQEMDLTVSSCLSQTAPNTELLINFLGSKPSKEWLLKIGDLATSRHIILQIYFSDHLKSMASATNFLADKASGPHLLFVQEKSWLRPDLLYRYHQAMLLSKTSDSEILYCNESQLDTYGNVVSGSRLFKPDTPPFPFMFQRLIESCWLCPKAAWQKAGKFRENLDDALYFDLVLRLDTLKFRFKNIPFFLFCWLPGNNRGPNLLPQSNSACAESLADYLKINNLNWKVSFDSDNRALKVEHQKTKSKIHVLIPFKDQFEITNACIRQLRTMSAEADIWITAIDNNSSDQDKIKELKKTVNEVLTAQFPFNFSKLNNFGISASACPSDFDLILFLNNDVILNPGSLLEMAGWLQHSKIGMVGMQLIYPSGLIQHGGVYFSRFSMPGGQSRWHHVEQGDDLESASLSRSLMITDAVTAAASMMRKKDFKIIRGFDEIFYPIGFSDSDLCLRIHSLGMYCLYTPFASGIHHESVSRGKSYIEDFEGSTWLIREKGLHPSSMSIEIH